MRNYDRYNPGKPAGIDNRRAHIVGGGIAGLAAAVFLIDDAQMPGRNITVYEELADVGGSMDGIRHEQGYRNRGERELEPNMECLWYLCAKIPSIDSPGMTILDETVAANREDHIHNETRALEKQGRVYDRIADFRMPPELAERFLQLLQTDESTIGDVTIDEFFGDTAADLYRSSVWITFHTMLAFKSYHSAIEMKRYLIRFLHHLPGMEYLRGILHTRYNEYDSIIKPIRAWLLDHGVTLLTGTTVTGVNLDDAANTVVSITATSNDSEQTIELGSDDFVIMTSGSMTQNSTFGDNTTVAPTNRDQDHRGTFSVWEKLAATDPKFGHPEKFLSDIDKTKWISAFVTVNGYREFFQRLQDTYGWKIGQTSGAISIVDSSWDISFVFYPKYYPDQPDDTDVFWFDTLYGERPGDYIKKPSTECTGEEILTELLYHLGMLDMKDELLAHSYISTAMMPYITSQFMPRRAGDRPAVVPEGCTNLALIGQYVELPGDVVFTVETSVRTAMMAAYRMARLDKPVTPLYEPQYDIRILLAVFKKLLGKEEDADLELSDLPRINPFKIKGQLRSLLDAANAAPVITEDETIY